MEDEEPVYFVMGSKTDCKTNVADTIASGLGAAETETSKAKVRTFARLPDSLPLLVDTVPFKSNYFENSNWLKFARTWISMNSLRRMFGRRVKLVCVVNSTFPEDYVEEDYGPFPKVSWLPLLAYIFNEFRGARIILVNSEDTCVCADRRLKMSNILQQHGIPPGDIVLANLSRRGLPAPLPGLHGKRQGFEPFLLQEVSSHKFEAWAPERVILFGRTGSGKSTVAEMLVSGELDPSRFPSQISSGIRGVTRKVRHIEGRGWFVVDTPGFGEPKDVLSSTSTDAASRKVQRYLQIIDGYYSHFVYVVKKDRIDKLEQRLWQFFLQLFGDKLLIHFTVVITDAEKEWVDRNRAYLMKIFDRCQSIVSVDFPPVKRDDAEWEAENKKTRAASLKAFEDELTSHGRFEAFCDLGRFSNWTARGEVASLTGKIRVGRSVAGKLRILIRAGALWAYADMRRLISMLIQDNRIFLLPLVDEDENDYILSNRDS